MNITKRFICSPILVSCRNYSQYPKNAILPVVKEKYYQQAVDSGEIKILQKLPIRAAHPTESSSMFNSYVVLKFINMVMREGKKDVARRQVLDTFFRIKKTQVTLYNKATDDAEKAEIILDPLRIFMMALMNGRPLLKLRPLRRGGSVYQIPMPISNTESIFLCMKWLVEAGKDKDGPITFVDKLSAEILDAAHNRGRVVKRKIELHKICEANRAYAHFRWS